MRLIPHPGINSSILRRQSKYFPDVLYMELANSDAQAEHPVDRTYGDVLAGPYFGNDIQNFPGPGIDDHPRFKTVAADGYFPDLFAVPHRQVRTFRLLTWVNVLLHCDSNGIVLTNHLLATSVLSTGSTWSQGNTFHPTGTGRRGPSHRRGSAPPGGYITLHILHLNDSETAFAKWPQISTLVHDLRQQGKCDLLVHTGDIRLGQPDIATVDAMNHMRFDAVTLGNHDFDLGISALVPQLARLSAATVCANVHGLEGVASVRMVERQGLAVAICGVTLESMSLFQPERNTPGITFSAARAALHDVLASVRATADLVILLSHCGLQADMQLAGDVPGIDVIIGGHSHDLLRKPLCVGSTWIVQAGAFGEYVGHLALTRDRDGWQVTGQVLPTADIPPDAAIAIHSRHPSDEVDLIIGEALADMVVDDYAQETPLDNLTSIG